MKDSNKTAEKNGTSQASEAPPSTTKSKGLAELQNPGKNLKAFAGADADHLSMSMIMSTSEAFPRNFTKETAELMTLLALKELSPKDPIEGMLCSQILALDAQGMRYLARAEDNENWLCHTEAAMNMAVKLLRLKNETIEALTRYRRKGEQKVVVQHISMNDQSKAIIGDIKTGGGGDVKS